MFSTHSSRYNNSGGALAGLFALFGGYLGCAFLLLFIMIGPWALQYDLNHWVPFVKPGFTPLGMSIFMFVGGLILFEIAVPIAILTWVCVGLGLIP